MIPLSIIVACSKDKKIDFTIEKTKYKNVISTKTKSQISALHAQNAGIIPAEIGYSPPSITNGITSTYKLKQGWHGTNNDKLTIEVALSKSGKEVKKDITVMPSSKFMDIEFAKYKNGISSKTRDEILNDIDSKKQGFTDQLFFLYDRGNKSDNKRDYAIKQKLFNIFGYSLPKWTKEFTIRFQWVDVLDKNNNSDYSFKLKIDICTQDKSKTKTIIIKTSDAP